MQTGNHPGISATTPGDVALPLVLFVARLAESSAGAAVDQKRVVGLVARFGHRRGLIRRIGQRLLTRLSRSDRGVLKSRPLLWSCRAGRIS